VVPHALTTFDQSQISDNAVGSVAHASEVSIPEIEANARQHSRTMHCQPIQSNLDRHESVVEQSAPPASLAVFRVEAHSSVRNIGADFAHNPAPLLASSRSNIGHPSGERHAAVKILGYPGSRVEPATAAMR
jgi:hypothetical protein